MIPRVDNLVARDEWLHGCLDKRAGDKRSSPKKRTRRLGDFIGDVYCFATDAFNPWIALSRVLLYTRFNFLSALLFDQDRNLMALPPIFFPVLGNHEGGRSFLFAATSMASRRKFQVSGTRVRIGIFRSAA